MRAAAWFVAFALIPAALGAAPALDGGGRDVSVALFSTHTVHTLLVTPIGPDAWTAACSKCAHKKFDHPVRFTAPGELFAGGMLRVSDGESGQTQTAAGLWHMRSTARGGEVDVVLTLPSERYVTAVLNAESVPGEPPQSLRALAVLARTYALNGTHYTVQAGRIPAYLCDSTECQAVRLGPVSSAIEEAVRSTAGETLWFGPRRAQVFFSQNCGGVTEDGGAVWPNLRGLPYLRSHADPYCIRHDAAAWHAEVSLADFAAIARAEHWRMPANFAAVRVTDRTASHRALVIAFSDRDGKHTVLAASALRFGIGRSLGWNRVRSDAYEVGLRNGTLIFDGRGHGHGVGLCQVGAAEMASEGKDYKAILGFYFLGTAVHITSGSKGQGDDGWHETHLGAMTVRTARELSSTEESAFAQTWVEAQRRFAPRRPIAPEIVIAPTTELFRQLTQQPGWELASTRGTTIVLQPASVFRSHSQSISETLLHEMLHVLIEAEASQSAPLWLREGLVEALSGERSSSSPHMSAREIDIALSQANSWAASEHAHHAAAALVGQLIARYGVSTVRGWLLSGPPSSVE